jgi:hypothetical protein
MRGTGRAFFVAFLLLFAGTVNVIYGIAAVSNARFFAATQYPFATLHTWGWITIIVGIIQVTGGISVNRNRKVLRFQEPKSAPPCAGRKVGQASG